MSIHTTIQYQDPNTSEVITVKKFKEYGSQKEGEMCEIDPVTDAMRHVKYNPGLMTCDNLSILVVDSQEPEWSDDHSYRLFPSFKNETSSSIVWSR